MKKYLFVLSMVTLLISCKKNISTEIEPQEPGLISEGKLDIDIRNQVQQSGQFDWNEQSTQFVWSALSHSDNILSVGYKPSGETNVEENLSQIDINSARWKAA